MAPWNGPNKQVNLLGDSNMKVIVSALSLALTVIASSFPAHRSIFDILHTYIQHTDKWHHLQCTQHLNCNQMLSNLYTDDIIKSMYYCHHFIAVKQSFALEQEQKIPQERE